ncbi:phage baseplate protein, partial [Tenacibaculum piscium]
ANGQNGTDNILGRMLVGYDANQKEFNSIGKKGGEKTHQLTTSELPSHQHEGRTRSGGIHSHDVMDGSGGSGTGSVLDGGGNFAGQDRKRAFVSGDGLIKDSESHIHYFTTDSEGNDTPHNNLPPYIVALPIQFIG